jgi:hypothetical protein
VLVCEADGVGVMVEVGVMVGFSVLVGATVVVELGVRLGTTVIAGEDGVTFGRIVAACGWLHPIINNIRKIPRQKDENTRTKFVCLPISRSMQDNFIS